MTDEQLNYLNNLSQQIKLLQKPVTYNKNFSETKYLESIYLNFNNDNNCFCIDSEIIPNFDKLTQVIFYFLECELQKLKKEFEEA